jgi:Polyketide synthase modules and related proteins
MSTATAGSAPVIVINPCGGVEPSPRIVAAAGGGGGVGVLDLVRGDHRVLQALERAASWSVTPVGVRVPPGCAASLDDVERAADGRLGLVVLPADSAWSLGDVARRCRVLAEVTSAAEARAAAAGGADGLIARGCEAGGRVGELSSFVLLQQLLADETLGLPVWVAGGIGPRTAAACVVGGAAGVVLDSQLALMPESDLPEDVRVVIGRMDGSETVLRDGLRGVPRGGRPDGAGELLPVGQDGWLAAVFQRHWRNTASAVRGIRAAISEAVGDAEAAGVLEPDAPLARALGVRIPVAQGPMTRVSDVAPFAAAVAGDGALPFIALALASGEQSRRMLRETAQALGDRPWGVGVLGFAPEEVRAAQLAAVREIRPRVAIIAGGRPTQARALEAEGIAAFLHVPSPGLLRQYLRAGARRFVFEGAECGGHVGPRTSLPLWEAQLLTLAEFLDETATPATGPRSASAPDGSPAGVPDTPVQVFFAGGIHDARSAAMVAAMAGPLVRRGVQVGVLMGTAYLFTREAVECGAIQPLFQRQVIAATGTAVLETAPGHVTRCLPSPYVDDFHRVRRELVTAGATGRDVWERLEMLNVGRLRIASKGRRRDGDTLVAVDEAGQHAEGLFMAGQVAVLRDSPTTVSDLHRAVTVDARRFHAARLAALAPAFRPAAGPAEPAPAAPLDIAIIGMSCVFPGSPDLASFWQTILSGRDTITEVPAQRWSVDTYYSPEVEPGQVGRFSVSKWGGFIAPVPFDAIGYGIPPAALASIDPTQLLALEAAHRALVDAGYAYDAPGADHSRTGVVFGAEAGSDMGHAQTMRTMLPAYLGEVPAALEDQLPRVTEDSFPGVLANVIAGRVANRLDLGGPNFTVDAACASSLAALDAACKELAAGTSDLMVCGGADLHNGINDYLMFTSAHALSPTGRCRPFDSAGDGISLGEGVACVVLKRLADAERDGDRIYAVIRGIGGSSDGRALGLTAPRAEGQRRALERAYARSGVSPRQVGLVEAHGTGTVVGDRTELETLTRLFVESGARPGSCALGSVKSQIGHTKCAAGLAGMIKATLALYTGVRPPTINLTRPNPAWDPERSPFAFFTEARPWGVPAGERIAAVSAFGFGGTNYHVVLAAHPRTPEPRHTRQEWPAELFCFRGPDRAAAHRELRRLVDALRATDRYGRPWRLRDLAGTVAAQADPRSGPVQVAIVARDRADLERLLDRALAGEHDPEHGLVQPPSTVGRSVGGQVAFLFPGQGSQQPGALAELFVSFPEVRRYLELGREWADLMFPPAAFDPATADAQRRRLRDTRVAQPALGIGGLAVAHLLHRLGVRPDLAGGHSYGELVALCTAGACDPLTLLRLSRRRADAILTSVGDDPGTMAAVAATAERVDEILARTGLAGQVVLANRNAPAQQVISGPTAAVRTAVDALRAAGLPARGLDVACAFHSPLVAPAVKRFAEDLAAAPIAAPRIPVWSNRTATVYPSDPDGIRRELAEQIGAPVRFVDQIESMYAAGARIFVEAGPGQVLTGLVRGILGDRPHLAVACDRRTGEGLRDLLVAVAELACAGVPVRTGWLFHDRDTALVTTTETESENRPFWTVDGQLVRDRGGRPLPGGMTPPRPSKELSMTSPVGPITDGPDDRNGRGGRDDLLAEFLRTNREMIAAQHAVMLAYLTGTAGGAVERSAQPQPAGSTPSAVAITAAPAGPIQPVPPAPRPSPGRTGQAGDTAGETGGALPALPVSASPAVPVLPRGAATAVPAPAGPAIPLPAAPAPAATLTTIPDGAGHTAADAANTAAGDGTSDPAPSTFGIPAAVLAVISERTGYPVDMIDLDLDLEADLSIDSIKRAEVAGEVATRLGLATEGDESELEGLVKARTVRAMVDWLTTRVNTAVAAAVPTPDGPTPNGALPPVPAPTWTAPSGPAAPAARLAPTAAVTAGGPASVAGHTAGGPTAVATATARLPGSADGHTPHGVAPKRMLPVVVPLPEAPRRPATTLTGATLVVTGAGSAAGRLVDVLRRHGAQVRTGTVAEPGDLERADGLVLLDGLGGGQVPLLPGAFAVIKQALTGGLRWLLAIVDRNAGEGADGLRGLFRTAAREYPSITARLVVVDGTETADRLAEHVLDELLREGETPVVDRSHGGRHGYDLAPASLGVLAAGGAGPAGEGAAEARALGLDRESVVVLVGGARGITPWFARALATAARCRVELVGRTPLPDGPVDPQLAAAADLAALRAALVRQGRRSPAEVERTAQALMAAREVQSTLTELRGLGAEVRYHTLDVRDRAAVRDLLHAVHRRYGRLDGLVYAAGVIEDRLIADKDPASFTRVYTTKVDGARAVLDTLDQLPAQPRFVVLFGSIAAAYGNRGQADYAAANDALDTLGARWAARTGNRCLTVHWGPWAPGPGHRGMVSQELSREYARRGIDLIDPEEGALSLLSELAWGDPRLTSVVYTASGW